MQSSKSTGQPRQTFYAGAAVLLVVIAVGIGAKIGLSGGFPTSASDPPREAQASPEATVRAMFATFDQFKDEFNTVHLLSGKDSSPEEQRFAELFWDRERSGPLYSALYDREPELQNISVQSSTDRSANVNAAVRALAKGDDSEKTDRLYIFELKKRGSNWYIYELRSNQSPTGVFEAFRKANGS
jgi:hypothetical protein